MIFVGDSQIREVSWAALKLLVPDAQLRFADGDPVFTGGRGGKKNNELRNTCVPQSVGKTGFTATCERIGTAATCGLHSPFHNKSHAEAMRKLLLTRPHDWDGALFYVAAGLYNLSDHPSFAEMAARKPGAYQQLLRLTALSNESTAQYATDCLQNWRKNQASGSWPPA